MVVELRESWPAGRADALATSNPGGRWMPRRESGSSDAWRRMPRRLLGRSSRDGGNDPVVRLEDQVVQITGGDGSHDWQLVGGVLDREDVQRPVPHGRPAQVRMVEAAP